MPIVVSVFPVQPAVNLDKVHLRELKITLTTDNPSKASVRIAYSLFGHDVDGDKHIDSQVRSVVIDDAFVKAASDAAAGKPALAQALNAIEQAIASILNESGDLGSVTKE